MRGAWGTAQAELTRAATHASPIMFLILIMAEETLWRRCFGQRFRCIQVSSRFCALLVGVSGGFVRADSRQLSVFTSFQHRAVHFSISFSHSGCGVVPFNMSASLLCQM